MSTPDPHSYTDTTQGTIEHIDLELEVDFTARRISGKARYRFNQALHNALDLDTYDVEIRSVSAPPRQLAWQLDMSDPILGQRLRVQPLGGERELTIEFTTGARAKALQWLEPGQTTGGKHPFLYTQCQSINARSILPCQDSPSVRFTYSARVRAPAPLDVVMAAAPGVSGQDDDGRFFHFEMPQPIPSYLFALAVGQLASRDISDRCRVYAEPEVVEAAAWEFAQMETQLQHGEALFGPYLWDRYDVLVLPRSFPFSGMENPRLTFLNPVLITGDRSETVTVAHELAHSWTGNLVTNATWEDFWLNEGWTSYADTRIMERQNGSDYAQLECRLRERDLLDDVNRYGVNSPFTCLNFSQKGIDPEDAFSRVPYYKGQFLIISLERAVGRPAFDRFLREYIEAFSFRSISTAEFLSFLASRLPQALSQVPVEDWIHKPGYPASAPAFPSKYFDQVSAAIEGYARGRLPSPQELRGWIPDQRLLFIKLLPPQIPPQDVAAFEELLGYRDQGSYFARSHFYRLAIRSEFKEIQPRAEAFVLETGPMLAMERVMRAMAQTPWSRPHARPLLERVRPRLHPVTEARLERELKKEGL